MKTLTAMLAAGLLLTATAVTLRADDGADKGNWDKEHPRREQVNQRLDNQDRRIHKEVKEGEMSKGEARKLHRQDHRIRKEERRDAAKHHGHITKREEKKLNRQENGVSHEIGH